MFTRLLRIRTVVLDSRADMDVRVGLTKSEDYQYCKFYKRKSKEQKIIVTL